MRRALDMVLIVGMAVGLGLIVMPASAVSPGDVRMVSEGVVALPAAARAANTSVTARGATTWNPDAGTGLVTCGAGYSSVNIEAAESDTVGFWACWRSGTTKANVGTVCRRRCVGCAKGPSYVAEVSSAQTDLFVISATDAGVSLSVECAR